MENLNTRWIRLPLYLLLLFYVGDNLVFSKNGIIEVKLLESTKSRLLQNNYRLKQEIDHLKSSSETIPNNFPSNGVSVKFIEIDNPITGRSVKSMEQAKFSERQWYLFSTTLLLLIVTIISFMGRSENVSRQ